MSELRHYGIIGMKWGVRKYQNADGSLTELGKERYQKDSAIFDKAYKKAKMDGYTDEDARQIAQSRARAGTNKEIAKSVAGYGLSALALGTAKTAGVAVAFGINPVAGVAVMGAMFAGGVGGLVATAVKDSTRRAGSEVVAKKILPEYGGTSIEAAMNTLNDKVEEAKSDARVANQRAMRARVQAINAQNQARRNSSSIKYRR